MPARDLRRSPPAELVTLLTELHRATEPGAGTPVLLPSAAALHAGLLGDLCEGAGFVLERRRGGGPSILRRQWTLPDTVGPDMRMLVCGLNPSPAAADAGVGFARPGNRFWPAALAAQIVTVDRDPDHALLHHGVGMTDIVKRTTRQAKELSSDEYARGMARVRRLVELWQPTSICFVGLAGWRSVNDRSATSGWQPAALGGRPVYVMPSTSGLNASSRLADLTTHLELAADPPS